MNAGSFLLGIQVIASWVTGSSPETRKGRRESGLSPKEQALVNRISDRLLQAVKRTVHPTFAPLKSSKVVHYVIFRQSKSWTPIRQMLNVLDSRDPYIKTWQRQWKDVIANLDREQKTVHDLVHAINIKSKECEKAASSLYLASLASDIKGLYNKILEARKTIETKVQEAHDELEANLGNRKLTKNPECERIIDYISTNWHGLTVFADWLEVPMEVDDIYAQVRTFDDSDEKDERGGKLAEDMTERLINLNSTKAIFVLEENEIVEKTVPFSEVEPGSILIPTEISLKTQQFGPASPEIKRSSSTVVLTDAEFFGVEHLPAGSNFLEKREETSSAHKSAKKVMYYAIEKVNNSLRFVGDPDLYVTGSHREWKWTFTFAK